MSDRRWTVVVAVALATAFSIGFAQGADDKKYPDWRGQWARFVVPGLPGQPFFFVSAFLPFLPFLPSPPPDRAIIFWFDKAN